MLLSTKVQLILEVRRYVSYMPKAAKKESIGPGFKNGDCGYPWNIYAETTRPFCYQYETRNHW